MSEPTPEYLAYAGERRLNLQKDVGEWFAHTQAPRVLEIGCGHGHFLAAYARAHPQHACLGVDLISHRLRLCMRKKRLQSISNVDFLKARAEELLEVLPAGSLWDRVFILYPDPWPKRRQEKHRLIQPAFLDLLGRMTTAAAELFFRTDHLPYYEWTVEHIRAHALWELRASEQWPFESQTFFQELMQKSYSLVIRKKG